ncbi:MAG: hypothetical protein G01um1014106_310 [Parcubacteria group bacterium Gr01-1014_106]|nr:MAG: hypothetical protein G01um1014106_310 [Parcubacteria group bacterium Gr01-1014_106]
MWERMPAFPYFYHDLVARITPGAILLGSLLWALGWFPTTDHSGSYAIALFVLFLGAAYAIGVTYEGIAFYFTREVTRKLAGKRDYYTCGFREALMDVRRREWETLKKMLGREVTEADHDPGAVGEIARRCFTAFENFELIASHCYNRGTRFLAEAKMASYSGVALLIAAGLLWTRLWEPWRWWCLLASAVTVVVAAGLMGPIAFARQRRRAVEVIACLDYLYRGVEYPKAHAWVEPLWKQMFAEPTAAPAALPWFWVWFMKPKAFWSLMRRGLLGKVGILVPVVRSQTRWTRELREAEQRGATAFRDYLSDPENAALGTAVTKDTLDQWWKDFESKRSPE